MKGNYRRAKFRCGCDRVLIGAGFKCKICKRKSDEKKVQEKIVLQDLENYI